LLGVNCGFGNSDIASLPLDAVDLDAGWVTFARVKTEISRRIPLWRETVDALRLAIETRPKPSAPEYSGLVFLTKAGRPWVRIKQRKNKPGDDQRMPVPRDDLAPRFTKLLQDLEINGRRGLGYYSCRHTFATVAGGAKDPQAVASIMGHVDASMTGQHQHGASDDRLRAVVKHVHGWLFGEGGRNGDNG
jgi:integrase